MSNISATPTPGRSGESDGGVGNEMKMTVTRTLFMWLYFFLVTTDTKPLSYVDNKA